MMKLRALFIAFLLLSPRVRADVTPVQENKVQKVNNDLKQDIIDLPRDSKRVTKLRERLRDTYANYTQVVRDHGSGTEQSRKAAKKVMAAQTELHKRLDKETGRTEITSPVPTPTKEEKVQNVEKVKPEEKIGKVENAEKIKPEEKVEKVENIEKIKHEEKLEKLGTPENVLKKEKKGGLPAAISESDMTDSSDEKFYDDIVKQFGANSPQAEAARRHLNLKNQ